jgi:thioester reductase-like protein
MFTGQRRQPSVPAFAFAIRKKWDKPLIGNPLPGVTYHILDEDLNEVKEGELYIGGRQLARGYLGNPELTNKKFISHKGQRLYKTGDKVRRHAKEDIEFIGRIDRQFKLRGQLVEPDEIEARILDYPGIERVAVIKKSESLAAFVQARGDLDIAKVKEFLSGKLPPWMIPQHMHILPEIPLTATGKPDFAVLQNIDLATGESSRVQPESDVEKKIFSAWKNVLRHENFGVTDSFFQIGGDSLGVIRLTLEAERQGIAVSAGLLSEYPTIRLLAAAIEGDLDGADVMSADDLRQQVAFETAWQDLFRQAEKRSGYPDMSNILLTGAAGFLGSRVLHELLQQTKATVYCLIRAKDTAAGLDRIKATLDKYELRLSSSDIARIVPICGDLTEKDFGIPNWQDMAEQIDAVYHCAAIVNMTASSRDLWPANVEGTQEVLRFCCEGKKKSLHYASTLSVFVSTDQNKGRLLESDRLEKTRQVYGGYAQTKWAAEYMLLQVPKKACTISHYRFGLITGDVKNGIGPCNDFLAMFARGMASLGAAPEDFEDILQVDITPVDYAARAMVEISLKGDKDIYHIANPKSMTLGGILSALKRGGKNVNLLPVAQWRGLAARADLTTEETAAILGLCRALPPEDFNSRRSMDLFQATDVVFDRRETALVTGAECPPASDSLMDLYIKGIFKGLY